MIDKNVHSKYLVKFIKSIPKSTWKRYEHNINSGLKILTDSGDVEVAAYILQNSLTTPNNIAKFMVRMQIEQINGMYDGIYSIKRDYKNEWKSLLESAGKNFEYALDNPHKKEQELDFARRQVMDCIRVFKNDLISHISVFREIDQYSETENLFKSWFSLVKCKKEMSLAIETVKRLLEAYKLLFMICSNSNDNISSIESSYYIDRKEIMSDDNCLLMAAYCVNKADKEFWCNLSSLWDEQKKFFDESMEVFRDSNKEENVFWDDEI